MQPSVTVEGSVVPGMGRLGRYQSQLLLHNDSESEPEFDKQEQPHQSHHQQYHRQQKQQRWANRARNRASYAETQQQYSHQRSYLPPFYASGDVSDISAHTVVNGNQIPLSTYHRNHRSTRKS